MKPTTFKIGLIMLLLGIMGAGCRKLVNNEIIREISPNNTIYIIEETIDSIDFAFYILNNKDNPSTVFKEGENFTFCFSVENKLMNSIIATTEFINSDFFRVYYTLDNVDMGKGWSGVWCEYNLAPKEIEYKSYVSKPLNCPWRISENKTPDYPLCMSEKNEYLAKGDYYTSVHLNFHYTTNGIKKIANSRIFKINFKIE